MHIVDQVGRGGRTTPTYAHTCGPRHSSSAMNGERTRPRTTPVSVIGRRCSHNDTAAIESNTVAFSISDKRSRARRSLHARVRRCTTRKRWPLSRCRAARRTARRNLNTYRPVRRCTLAHARARAIGGESACTSLCGGEIKRTRSTSREVAARETAACCTPKRGRVRRQGVEEEKGGEKEKEEARCNVRLHTLAPDSPSL